MENKQSRKINRLWEFYTFIKQFNCIFKVKGFEKCLKTKSICILEVLLFFKSEEEFSHFWLLNASFLPEHLLNLVYFLPTHHEC